MDRRRFVGMMFSIGVPMSIAGCTESEPETEGDDDNPINTPADELALDVDDFDEAGWSTLASLDNTDETPQHVANRMVNQNEDVLIVSSVWVYESVSDAKESYDERHETESGQYSTEEIGVGSEGFGFEPQHAVVIFRDANVIGRIRHEDLSHGSDGDIDTAVEYAADKHERWRS